MLIEANRIQEHNHRQLSSHEAQLDAARKFIPGASAIIERLREFQVAIPSWALGTGGTRFGRFPGGGEPRSLEEKLQDVGLLHTLNRSSGSVSLHIPWDIPSDTERIKALAK